MYQCCTSFETKMDGRKVNRANEEKKAKWCTSSVSYTNYFSAPHDEGRLAVCLGNRHCLRRENNAEVYPALVAKTGHEASTPSPQPRSVCPMLVTRTKSDRTRQTTEAAAWGYSTAGHQFFNG